MTATVFIVDDEPMIQSLYRDVLELEGHKVVGEAADGEECMEKMTMLQRRPDYVIMDHRMPRKDGLETAEEILRLDPRQHIVFITADSTVEKHAHFMGASFLPKPFNLDMFKDLFR